MHGKMNEIGWTGERGWVWFPTLITLILSIVLGWILFKKKNKSSSDIF